MHQRIGQKARFAHGEVNGESRGVTRAALCRNIYLRLKSMVTACQYETGWPPFIAGLKRI
jgi:hypothetical protein